MATRLKTIEYYFPILNTAADNVTTNFTQITVYIPETIVSFKSVYVQITADDSATTLSPVLARNIGIRLAAVAYETISNTNQLTASGEQFSLSFGQDFTSYFTTNWTGTSMTMDCQVTINTSAAGTSNLTSKVTITYEYDDTSSTHIKTVYIPLNAPTSALPTSKQITPDDTIPALDTFCPEASKTFRQIALVIQGNTELVGVTTDSSISYGIDAVDFTSQLFENGLNGARSYRIANVVSFTTNATHEFFLWASLTDFDHPQVWLQVTYEFDPSTSTSILNSLLLPMQFNGPMGTSSTTYNRATRDLWIQEDNITVLNCALMMFYEQSAPIAGLNARVGTGSFISYSSAASVVGGSMGLMIRNDSISLDHGRNTLQADMYNTDTTDPGGGTSSFWIINYTSDKHSEGVGAHNHTIQLNIIPTSTVSAQSIIISGSKSITFPETNFFITALGGEYMYDNSGTINAGGCFVGVERLASTEGGLIWESAYESMNSSDPEISFRWAYFQSRSIFNRWTGDVDSERLPLDTSRRWMVAQSPISFHQLNLYITYHTITYTVSGTISGSTGGTVNIELQRVSGYEPVLSTSRTGNGSYSFTWYDDTEELFITAKESDSLRGVSKDDLVATDFDINLSSTSGGGEYSFAFA